MLIFRDISIKQKLNFIILFTSAIALLIACTVFVIYDQITFKNNMTRNLVTLAEIIGDNCTAALTFYIENDAKETLSALNAEQQIVSACIYEGSGKVFAEYHRSGAQGELSPPEPQGTGIRFLNDHLILFQPIVFNQEVIGTIYIKADLHEMHSRMQRYAGIVAIVLFVSVLVVLLLTSKLQHLISRPILHLSKVAQNVSVNKDYSFRAEKYSEDELGSLTERFNEMLSQIQYRDEELQKAHDELEERVKERTKELENEITIRKRGEEQIKTSLREKEVLLKEIHHRVKNNLQVICSLLHLQSRKIKDQEALELFKESQNRVKSMALIHEKLYRSEDFANINFAEYIKSLTTHLLQTYRTKGSPINLKINVEEISLTIETAIPCGLIINELVSNSLKYAFPEGREGEINIEFFPNDGNVIPEGDDLKYTLKVSDNGIGFPEDLDFRNTQSLGLQLVNNLTNQLDGTIVLGRTGGTTFSITFGSELGIHQDQPLAAK